MESDLSGGSETSSILFRWLATQKMAWVCKMFKWMLFLGATFFFLRPILMTTVAADDLINPFSQFFHSGQSFSKVMDRTIKTVSLTGHFNYLGQMIGSSVLMLWMILIGDLGINYSVVYASTKFIVFSVCLIVCASIVRHLLNLFGIEKNIWKIRIFVLLGLVATLQIHIPWSNDPVASYPLSGFFTSALGLLFIIGTIKTVDSNSWLKASGLGILGICIVLYYEYNSFAVFAVLPLLVSSFLNRKKSGGKLIPHFFFLLVIVLPSALLTCFFYLTSRSSSINYSGTAISLKDPFVKTFLNGLVSALPTSGWVISKDWLGGSFIWDIGAVSSILIGGLMIVSLFIWNVERGTESRISKFRASNFFVAISPFVIYWFGTTFVQTATTKVQAESTRIGHVYNYHAVAVLCFVIIFVLGLRGPNWPRLLKILKIPTLVIFVCVMGFQILMNWNIMSNFNKATYGSRNLLEVYSTKPDMITRCEALNVWKGMGWPEYYWLDMELGLNKSYEHYYQEQFCAEGESTP